MKRTRTDVVFPFKTVPPLASLPTTRARQNYDPSHEFKRLGSNQSETEGFHWKFRWRITWSLGFTEVQIVILGSAILGKELD
jgi:hypothetical protein